MSRDRYLEIFNNIHFNDINVQNPDDTLIKLLPLINRLKENYAGSFYPFKNLCILCICIVCFYTKEDVTSS